MKDVIELQKGRIDDLNDSRETRERRCEELRNELAVLEKSKTSMNAKLEGLTSIAEKFAVRILPKNTLTIFFCNLYHKF